MSGIKYDSQKPRMDLLPRAGIEEIAKVLEVGAKKYGDRNWAKGMDWGRLYAATLRHVFASLDKEDKDPESGLDHLAHAACNLLFLLEYKKKGLGNDNR